MEKLAFVPRSGLGDQLLDTIGFLVICKIKCKTPVLEWCKNALLYEQPWGQANYSIDLFKFPENVEFVDIIDKSIPTFISINTGASFNIINLRNYLGMPASTIIEEYNTITRSILPGNIKFTNDISKCIGIHLRRTDKIKNKGDPIDIRHETTLEEYSEVIIRLKECVRTMISNSGDYYVWFFVCSEDKEYKNQFMNELISITKMYNKSAKFYNPIYNNLDGSEAVIDMFSLSKCHCILQGIKYSTFSIIASIIGNNILYNFAKHDDKSLLNLWKPLIKLINNGIFINGDISSIEKVNNQIANITTIGSVVASANSFNRFLPKSFKRY